MMEDMAALLMTAIYSLLLVGAVLVISSLVGLIVIGVANMSSAFSLWISRK